MKANKNIFTTFTVLCLFVAIFCGLCLIIIPKPVYAETNKITQWDPGYAEYEETGELYYIFNFDINGNVSVNGNPVERKFKTLYVLMQGPGGSGGYNSRDNARGYGGGSGALVLVKINVNQMSYISVQAGSGGNYEKWLKYPDFTWQLPSGRYDYREGFPGLIIAEKHISGRSQACINSGRHATTDGPGMGGVIDLFDMQNGAIEVLQYIKGNDGGMPSVPVNIEIKQDGYELFSKYFTHKISGFAWSGIGGAASPYAKGGDGGVLMQRGQDGTFGSGGGGSGLSGKGPGNGGKGYMEFFTD